MTEPQPEPQPEPPQPPTPREVDLAMGEHDLIHGVTGTEPEPRWVVDPLH